jgi:hypothetical protein
MPAGKHALLSASSAERWLSCPPSALLTRYMPDTASEYAEEGRLAHEVAELHLREKYTDPLGYKKFQTALRKLKNSPFYNSEMDRYIADYVDYVDLAVLAHKAKPLINIEKRVSFEDYVPDGFGTCDALILSGDMLHIIDLKYGKGVPVSVERNPQIMLYALGALSDLDAFEAIEFVKLSIAQPRLDAWLEWETTAKELRAWGGDVAKPAADLAIAGYGEYKAGSWCRFCKAKFQCAARSSTLALEGIPRNNEIGLLDNAELARRIMIIAPYVEILSDLKEHALSECLAGRAVPGYKAVEGRSNRTFTDIDAAFQAAIKAGFDEADLFKREPVPLTAVERLLGRAFKEIMGPYVTKTPGRPTFAPDSDARPAITKAISAADAFDDNKLLF